MRVKEGISESVWLNEEDASYVALDKKDVTRLLIQDGISNVILLSSEAKSLRDFLNQIDFEDGKA